ncbi:MAG: protein-methionine-sulfoxide reductase heme-binding subunit MsrQ [Myxococcota bacterium]|jgi:sulfoxide reductase heme-binding subunit YedZ
MALERKQKARALHAGVLLLCALPAGQLAFAAAQAFSPTPPVPPPLGANPVEFLEHSTGLLALRFLALCLAVTPLQRLGWKRLGRYRIALAPYRNALVPYRRSFGLVAFGYASIHLAIFVGLDLGFDWKAVGEDLAERPYILVGFAAFVILAALAATSTRRAMRRLGRRWKRLHRGLYLAAGLAVVHFAWVQKADFREPALYAGIIGVLLLARVVPALASRRRAGDSSRP